MTKPVKKWRLTKTALRQLTRDLDGLRSIVEHAAHRAEQLDDCAIRHPRLADEYEQAAAAYRGVAKDVIARVDKLAEECRAAADSADDIHRDVHRRLVEIRRQRRAASGDTISIGGVKVRVVVESPARDRAGVKER